MHEVDRGSAVSQSEDEILGQNKVVVHKRGSNNASCVNLKSNAGHEVAKQARKETTKTSPLVRIQIPLC